MESGFANDDQYEQIEISEGESPSYYISCFDKDDKNEKPLVLNTNSHVKIKEIECTEFIGVKLEHLDSQFQITDFNIDHEFDYMNGQSLKQYNLNELEPLSDSSVKAFKTQNVPFKKNSATTNDVPPIRKRCHSETKRSIARRKNNPLLEFFDNPQSNMKKGKTGPKKAERDHPKKEYYRIKLIRSWKKAIRKQHKNVIKIDSQNEYEKLFYKHTKHNLNVLSNVGSTESGPQTESVKKNSKKVKDAKTFNNTVVQEMFMCRVSRESFELFVNMIFHGKNCDELCRKFYFNCCWGEHTKICEDKWERLRKFSYTKMIDSNLEVDNL